MIEGKLNTKIKNLAKQGNSYFSKGKYDESLWKFSNAIDLIGSPKHFHSEYTWLLSGVGDVYFAKKEFKKSANAFYDALNSLGGQAKGFIHLRLGQCLYELGDKKASEDHLFKSYMLEGSLIFKDEDRKYMNIIVPKLENHLRITFEDKNSSIKISEPLPIQKEEALKYFESIDKVRNNFFTLQNDNEIVQFSFDKEIITLDIPKHKDKGSLVSKVTIEKARKVISSFFDDGYISMVNELVFEKW